MGKGRYNRRKSDLIVITTITITVGIINGIGSHNLQVMLSMDVIIDVLVQWIPTIPASRLRAVRLCNKQCALSIDAHRRADTMPIPFAPRVVFWPAEPGESDSD